MSELSCGDRITIIEHPEGRSDIFPFTMCGLYGRVVEVQGDMAVVNMDAFGRKLVTEVAINQLRRVASAADS